MERLTIQQILDNSSSDVKKNDIEYCLMDCLGKDRVFLHTQKNIYSHLKSNINLISTLINSKNRCRLHMY